MGADAGEITKKKKKKKKKPPLQRFETLDFSPWIHGRLHHNGLDRHARLDHQGRVLVNHHLGARLDVVEEHGPAQPLGLDLRAAAGLAVAQLKVRAAQLQQLAGAVQLHSQPRAGVHGDGYQHGLCAIKLGPLARDVGVAHLGAGADGDARADFQLRMTKKRFGKK